MEIVKSAMFAKIEAQYGTDPTPVEGSDAIEIYGRPTFELLTSQKERNVPMGHFGKIAPLIVGEAYKLSGISVPLKGSGAAGTAPRIDPLLRCLGLEKTTSAGVSVSYAVHSDFAGESCTIYFWFGGTRHILKGCVGTGKLNLTAGEVMMLDIEITGVYGGTISDVTFPSPTFEATTREVWDAANFKCTVDPNGTPAVVALVISKFEIDLGNQITKRLDPNGAYGINRYFIKDREVKITLDPEKEELSTFNPYTLHINQTQINFETKPAGTAGNKVEILVNGVTLEAPKLGERENIAAWDLSGQARPTIALGDNEFSVVFK